MDSGCRPDGCFTNLRLSITHETFSLFCNRSKMGSAYSIYRKHSIKYDMIQSNDNDDDDIDDELLLQNG